MNLHEIKDIIIYINIFAHYPETYNANTISSYFSNTSILNKDYSIDYYAMINSAPHIVNKSVEIEISLNNDNIIIDKKAIIVNLKESAIKYFNDKI